jgi:pheromone alpha factor receptor
LGVEVGVLLLMLLITIILSKPEKRKGKIFKLNIATMITGFLRVLFLALYNDSRGQAFYIWFSYDHSGLTHGNYAVSMLAEVFSVIMVALIEASLWVQARTVTQSYQMNWKKTVVFVFSAFFAFLAIGFRIVYSVFDSIGVLYKGQYIYNKGQWIQQTSVTLTSASIIWFCGIFGSKMWITYKDRKSFASYQFKPMDYFIVGACCTMFIPSKYHPNIPRSQKSKTDFKFSNLRHPRGS